ncbi:MAG: phosphatidate cytidylyltransferase [Alphaproteobacteria bacterium]
MISLPSSLVKRILSAAVIAPCFLYVIIKGDLVLAAWLGLSFGLSVFEWYGLSKKTQFFVPTLIMGIVYMALSYGSFMALREAYSINVLLLFLAMIWASDIGAYFVGKTVGGPKLIQKISPNKTWSGFAGALFFPALVAFIWIAAIGFHKEFDGNSFYIMYPMAIIIGIVTGCVGQAGDLLVSFVKRQADVKDTGSLIPGHGGLLDRIDSMLLGAPVFFILITLLSYVF